MTVNKAFIRTTATVACLGLATSVSSAVTLPTNVISVSASAGGQSGTVDIDISNAIVVGDALQWVATSDISILDGGDVVATIQKDTSIIMGFLPTAPTGDASIRMTFFVQANTVADTVFSISSGALTNLAYTNADALATGGITVTDSNNNGAEVRALNAGGTRFANFGYNAGLTFADLIDGSVVGDADVGNITTVAGGSLADAENSAAPGVFLPIGPVTEMEINYSFELTAGDQASGTAFFIVFPTPASAALLGLGGLVAVRRRR
ncbi:MAG: hypothetical protein DHS20C14_16610 [Phycisphaeraceae bacterium]|nr:MAG: hypothetical protein DHS20C14_16610 [Phycisphaeraceae bacterium]